MAGRRTVDGNYIGGGEMKVSKSMGGATATEKLEKYETLEFRGKISFFKI